MQLFRATHPTADTNILQDNIDQIDNDNSLRSLFSGDQFPTNPAPVVGQPCYRTDQDKLYIYTDDGWLEIAEHEKFINAVVSYISSSVDGNFVVWDGSTGRTIKDSGKSPSDFAPLEISVSARSSNYILALSDKGSLIEMNSPSALTVIVPTNSSVPFAIGTQILIVQSGAGQVNISGASGVTIKKNSDFIARTAGQNSMVGLVKSATNTWYLFGDLEEA